MKSTSRKTFAVCLLSMLFLIFSAFAYELGDVTDDWEMWDAWQEIHYRLYDYEGKLVLVNLWKDT